MSEDGKKKEDVRRQKRQCKSDSKALTYVLSKTINIMNIEMEVSNEEKVKKKIGYAKLYMKLVQ